MTKGRVAAGVLAALFVAFAALQLNDPDPVQWVAIYASAAVGCALFAAGKRAWPVHAAVTLAALVWAAVLLPEVAAHPPTAEHLTTWKMMDPSVEESRELGGLVIVAASMIPLAIASRPRKS